MSQPVYDVAIIGGGIVGLATAHALLKVPGRSLIVVEAERTVAAHQTSHNSGVIHSGLYYKPGSLKAKICVVGREEMYRFCQEHGVPHDRCGKLVVAVDSSELPALEELERRGHANGLAGLRRLRAEEIADYEPHCRGVAALHVPETGIASYRDVARVLASLIEQRGGSVKTQAKFRGLRKIAGETILETTQGPIACRHVINCAGLQSDRVARLCGVETGVHIFPFRGEYYEIVPERKHLIRNLIYPVPDARFPFLGVHFTRTTTGMIEAGPNAVLAFRREGYGRLSFSMRDVWQLVTFGGFWKMAWRYGGTGMKELYRSFSKNAFLHALQRLVPEIRSEDIRRAGSGVRAQAVEANGYLVDDFRIVQHENMVHVLNAPSPAATASLRIGATVAERAHEAFGWPPFSG